MLVSFTQVSSSGHGDAAGDATLDWGHWLKQIEAVRHKLEDPAGSLSWVNQASLLLRVVDTLLGGSSVVGVAGGMQHLHILLGGLELAPDVDSETSADDRVATQPARPEDVANPSHVLDDALGNLPTNIFSDVGNPSKRPCNAFVGEKYRLDAHMKWLRERKGTNAMQMNSQVSVAFRSL